MRYVLMLLSLVATASFAAGGQPSRGDGPSVRTSTGDPLVVSPPAAPSRSVTDLEKRVAELERKVAKPAKDGWDKMAAASTLISGVLVALIGFYATSIYNRKQQEQEDARKERHLSVEAAATIEKFMPHLTSTNVAIREAALVTISSLVDEGLAAKLAVKIGGEAGGAALAKMAATPGRDAALFENAFGTFFAALRPSVVRILVDGKMRANGFFIDTTGVVITAAHVVVDGVAAQIQMPDGTIVPAQVTAIDKKRDLAKLKANTAGPVVAVDVTGTPARSGDRVIMLWESPDNGFRGEVGEIVALGQMIELSSVPEIAVAIQGRPGMSGAPVVNVSGTLIGVLHASMAETNTSYLIPASEIAKLGEACRLISTLNCNSWRGAHRTRCWRKAS